MNKAKQLSGTELLIYDKSLANIVMSLFFIF